ncbi:hypothetical protein FJTKL_02869 [Diaporthe vaccinii]|uniref:NADH-ubiquinone oxidoreductase 14.8 kDa subunit n=1 Tax=Diaporthe vaccinii TaxID=105482 RepID=A0ABR4F2U8_9PEZI
MSPSGCCQTVAAAMPLRVSQWADDVALQAPEIQTMYNVPFPVSVIRTRIREEFERNRFVNKLPIVDVLLFKSDAEYQETMNFWKQSNHVMSFFKEENFRGDHRLPSNFMSGFLEGRN